MIRELVDNIQ